MKTLTNRYLALVAIALVTGVAAYAGGFGCGSSHVYPPGIEGTYPVDGASGAAIDTVVTATFDAQMNAETVDTDSFSLRLVDSSQSPAIEGEVSYDSSQSIAAFTPSAPLDYGMQYVATISSTVKDTKGKSLGTDYSWVFTTQNADSYFSLELMSDFGNAGILTIDPGRNVAYGAAIKVQADGKVIMSGYNGDAVLGANAKLAIVRFDEDGVLDAGFGTGGKVEIDFGLESVDIGNAIALLPDGQMILGGESNTVLPLPAGGWEFWVNNDFSLTMLDASGAINTHFGVNGYIFTDILGDHDDILAMTTDNVVTDGSGNVVSFELYATGLAKDPAAGDFRYAVAKYRSVIVEVPQ